MCIAWALVLCAAAAAGCSPQIKAENLMRGVTPASVSVKTLDEPFTAAAAHFSIELFKNSFSADKNSLISPTSVLLALAMAANGAGGDTLAQMESVLGGELDIGQLNEYLHSYVKGLPSEDKSKLEIANSIWFRDQGFTVNQDFLQANADYYGADAFKAAFDNGTAKDINNWIKKATDGLIDKMLDEIPAEAVMYLINAVLFDAEWAKVYEKSAVRDGQFTDVKGAKQTVQFMHSSEARYLESDNATGFIKPYAGNKYSFVALLPAENISIGAYVGALSGESFMDTVKNAEPALVNAATPKFRYDYEIKMNDGLAAMGIADAFDSGLADFSGMGSADAGNLYIDEVLHKAVIAVDEKGTKAGAVTVFSMRAESADPSEVKTVILDRPFLYAIIDNAANLPIFMGTVLTF